MFGMGENHGQVIESSWDAAVKIKRRRYIAQSRIRTKAILGFEEIEPKFVASGHGFCITIVG